MTNFKPNSLPLLIGSLPVSEHAQAVRLILESTPEIPLWPQLPVHRQEGMLRQFLPGFPGMTDTDDTVFINTASDDFDGELLSFYEEYMAVTEAGADLDNSRFALTAETAKGFFTFLEAIENLQTPPTALKGQITGPITFATAIKDENGRAIFYNDQLKDVAVKLLALKAGWQVRQMIKRCPEAIVFFDEPGLAGFGSSAFITIGADEITACLNEVCAAVHAEKGLAGVHVCANTEWPIVFAADVDILSCDTYSYFDKLLLYPDHLRRFFERGGILANGIIPTIPEYIHRETVDSLTTAWFGQRDRLQDLGIAADTIAAQTLITPSCGTGSISMDDAQKVLDLTKEVSGRVQKLT